MVLGYEVGDGAHALDVEQLVKHLQGTQVINPGGGSNEVDDNNTSDLTIRAKSGDLLVNGSVVSASEETANLSSLVDADNPRKVLVYRDSAGNLQTNAGSAESAQPSGATRRDAYRPAPPTKDATTIVVLATVWLPAGASSVANADIRDRRLASTLEIDTLDAQTVQADDVDLKNTIEKTQNGIFLSRDSLKAPLIETHRLVDVDDTNRVEAFDYTSRGNAILYINDRLGTRNSAIVHHYGQVNVTLVSDPGNHFSTTANNSGTINIYHNNGDNTVYIENETGSDTRINYTVIGIGG